jgi:hypothetical protein
MILPYGANLAGWNFRKRQRENSAEFGREFNLSLKDITSFYNKYLVWLCWQSAANCSPLSNSLITGKIEGI